MFERLYINFFDYFEKVSYFLCIYTAYVINFSKYFLDLLKTIFCDFVTMQTAIDWANSAREGGGESLCHCLSITPSCVPRIGCIREEYFPFHSLQKCNTFEGLIGRGNTPTFR